MTHISKFITGLMLLAAANVYASTINYAVTDLGGGSWQYDYTVINDSLGGPLYEFTIDFDRGLYENLVAFSAPAGWDGLVVQTGSFIDLNNGFYDALLLLPAGLGPDESASIFSVQFDWLGGSGSQPASQAFVIVDPVTFVTLDAGRTTLATPEVPLPGAALLFLNGLGLLAGFAHRRRRLKLTSADA